MQRPSMGWARAFTKLLGAAQAVCSEDRVRCVRGGRRAPPALRTNHLEPPDAVSGTSDAWTPRVRRPWAALAPVPPLRIHSDASLPVKLQGRPPRPALWRQRRCVGIVGGHQVLASPSSAGSARASSGSKVRLPSLCRYPRLEQGARAPPSPRPRREGIVGGHQVLASPSSAGSARALLVRVNRKYGFPRWVAARASDKERESHRRHDHTEEASWGGRQVLTSPTSAGSARASLVRVNRKCGFPRWVAARASDKERESH